MYNISTLGVVRTMSPASCHTFVPLNVSFAVCHFIPLKVEWESDLAVRITGRLDTQIFKQEASISGVQVAYAN